MKRDVDRFLVSRSSLLNPALRNLRERGLYCVLVGEAQWRDGIHPTVAGDVRLNRGELLISARAWAAEWGYAESSFRGLLRRWAAGGLIEIDTRRVARRVGLVIVILHYYQHLRIVGVDRAAPAGSPLAGRGKPAKGKDEYPKQNQPTTDGSRDRSAEALRNGCETAASEPRSEGNITRINQCTNPSLRKKKEEEKKIQKATPAERRRAVQPDPQPDLLSEVHAPTATERMWRDGPSIVMQLTGLTAPKARSLLGRMRAELRDDCIRVMEILGRAQERHPLMEPAAFLMAAARGGGTREKPEPRYGAEWMAEYREAASGDDGTAYDLDLKAEPVDE